MATEPEEDGHAAEDYSDEGSESFDVSREDTMVEHSVVINDESSPGIEEADYMQALQSVKYDECVDSKERNILSGECSVDQESETEGTNHNLRKSRNKNEIFTEE